MEGTNYVHQRRNDIARNLRSARQEKGWTQNDVADYLGCSRRRVNRVEKGQVEFFWGELELLAQAFKVPVKELTSM